MKYSILISILVLQYVQMSEGSAVYYVLPTEPLSSCQIATNITCPPNQVCHTMDYLAENRNDFFSPDYYNITLIFMCGVHNHTQDLHVQNHYSFIMKGETGAKKNTIISMLPQMNNTQTVCTQSYFLNISFVEISSLTLHCPSIVVKGGFLTITNSNLYGHKSTSKLFSTITVTTRDSEALLDDCTFKQNCFVMSNMSNGITVHNCTFQSYWHETGSVLVAYSSVVTLTGFVNISNTATGIYYGNYSSGAAIFLRTTHPEFQSILEITNNTKVYFTNSTCSDYGGAVYVENGAINIGARATVVFMHNKASSYGGAVCLANSIMNLVANSNVVFAYNNGYGYGGGAIGLRNGELNINTGARVSFSYNTVYWNGGGAISVCNGVLNISSDASVTFSHNSAEYFKGGALDLSNTTFYVDTDILFYNNTARTGAAIQFNHGTMHINANVVAQFIKNTAYLQGGAIFINAAHHPSVIIKNSAKIIFANNSAFQGGALYNIATMFAIEVGYKSRVNFVNNTATDVGGAVYTVLNTALPCLFVVTHYSAEIIFIGNAAHRNIGQHIYGSSTRQAICDSSHLQLANTQGLPYTICDNSTKSHTNFTFSPDLKETMSPVSSAPWRVCLCDSLGRPQCANIYHIFTSVNIYRGEVFSLPVVVVGYDFGTTFGGVYSEFLYSNQSSKLEPSQYNQLVNSSKMCTSLNYTVLTKYDSDILQLQTSALPVSTYGNSDNHNNISMYKLYVHYSINSYITRNGQIGCIDERLLTTPVFINVALLPGCPPGLTLIQNLTRCSCYPILASNGFKCFIQNKTGYLKWNTAMWVNATYNESQSNGIIYNHFCPIHYCKPGEKMVRIKDDSNKQCASNRTGILCGACMENFSLAIGSSRCIECHNDYNLSLLLVFAAGGVLLVFFILALNLTVTQGLINGLIFYANIVWAYEEIVFPSVEAQNKNILFIQVFIAWINLDFGVETCFFTGLNTYWKTWLQFLFPFYIWAIAGVIIVACRYSSRLTNLIGSRAVPLLATLFLLSYMKLLRTIADAASVAVITHYPQNTFYTVWYLDGNLHYCQHPHIYLFIAATLTLVFLWLPYTLLLLFIQILRRVSHLRPLKWINRFAPVYDAYFSPLKNKHQYWFGTMLLVRGILLVIMTVTPATNPELMVFILLVIMIVLLVIISVKNVYKKMKVRVLEGVIFMNLLILSAGTLYKWESTKSKTTMLAASIGLAFAQFCIIVAWSLIKVSYTICAGWKCRQSQTYDVVDEDDFTHERIEDPELEAVHVMIPAKNIATLTN